MVGDSSSGGAVRDLNINSRWNQRMYVKPALKVGEVEQVRYDVVVVEPHRRAEVVW